MASFEERLTGISAQYDAAARTQDLRLFRETMKEHQDLVHDEGTNGIEPANAALLAAGRRVLGRDVSAANIRELVELVSSVREDMTDSQRLAVFLEDLLATRPVVGVEESLAWPQVSVASQRRIQSYTARQRRGGGSQLPDPEDIDMTPNRSIGGAAWGIGAVLAVGLVLAGLLYLVR